MLSAGSGRSNDSQHVFYPGRVSRTVPGAKNDNLEMGS